MTENFDFEPEGDIGPADAIPGGDPVGEIIGSDEGGEVEDFDPGEIPASSADYNLGPDWQAPEGVEWGAERQGRVLEAFHRAGLSQRQTREILEVYRQETDADTLQYQGAAESVTGQGLAELKAEWGDRYTANIAAAQKTFRDLAGGEMLAEEFAQLLLSDGTLLGSHPTVIRFAHKIAERDQTRQELRETHPMGSASTENLDAADERARLQSDPGFVAALTDKVHPMHDSALRKWNGLIRLELGSDADRPTPL